MKALVLFSGTGSIEKVFNISYECRGLDIDNKFRPYYNTDILTWDYETELKNWTPDFIHASPVCSSFSRILKSPDKTLGISLVVKTLEIIEYVKTLNPKLKFTIENPVGHMRHLEIMKPYNRITTSYCMYGFPYRKNTDIWSGGFDLDLKLCNKKSRCRYMRGRTTHPVRIAYKSGDQMLDSEYTRNFKNLYPDYVGYKPIHYRYRIPSMLVYDIYRQVITGPHFVRPISNTLDTGSVSDPVISNY